MNKCGFESDRCGEQERVSSQCPCYRETCTLYCCNATVAASRSSHAFLSLVSLHPSCLSLCWCDVVFLLLWSGFFCILDSDMPSGQRKVPRLPVMGTESPLHTHTQPHQRPSALLLPAAAVLLDILVVQPLRKSSTPQPGRLYSCTLYF